MRGWWRGMAFVCLLLAGCPEESEAGHVPSGGRTLDDPPLDDSSLEDAGVEPDAAADSGAYSTDDVPDGRHCEAVARWSADWATFEEDVVAEVNEARERAQDCHTGGQFEATGPVAMEPHLRCAARLHTEYMAEAIDDFGHESRAGSLPSQRVTDTGYTYSVLGENLAVGLKSPEDVVKGWLKSDGHCKVMMQPDFTEVGIGYALGEWDSDSERGIIDAPYVTMDLATPH